MFDYSAYIYSMYRLGIEVARLEWAKVLLTTDPSEVYVTYRKIRPPFNPFIRRAYKRERQAMIRRDFLSVQKRFIEALANRGY